MTTPFIFISSAPVKDGKLADYRRAWAEVEAVVREQEPRMIHFGLYLSEDGTRESTVQVHPDAESMAHHMTLVADHVQASGQYLDFSSMRIQIFGTPNEAVLDQMRQLAGTGVPISIQSLDKGFHRMEVPAQHAP